MRALILYRFQVTRIAESYRQVQDQIENLLLVDWQKSISNKSHRNFWKSLQDGKQIHQFSRLFTLMKRHRYRRPRAAPLKFLDYFASCTSIKIANNQTHVK